MTLFPGDSVRDGKLVSERGQKTGPLAQPPVIPRGRKTGYQPTGKTGRKLTWMLEEMKNGR